MRYIEDLRNLYKGKEIWVLGCGPSLDNFPKDFFDDKIAIVTNGAIKRFLVSLDRKDRYYHFYHSFFWNFINGIDPELFRQCIMLVPSGDLKEYHNKVEEFPHYQKPIWTKWGNYYTDKSVVASIKAAMGGKPYLYTGAGTVVHTALQIAFILGANLVTLAGCEMKVIGQQRHAEKGGMKEIYDDEKKSPKRTPLHSTEVQMEVMRRQRTATYRFNVEIKKYGREMKRFYYPQGYEEIVIDQS